MQNKIIRFEECDSTNSEALRLLRNLNVSEGTIVTAVRQTKGRGRRGTVWESEPGSNLTFSVILFPSFLTSERQFYLSMCAALSMTDVLRKETGENLKIKWPNDVYVDDRKIAGILIENQWQGDVLKSSVVGMGLNVNQTFFDVPEAASLKQITQKTYDTDEMLSKISQNFDERYRMLREGNFSAIKRDYLDRMYALGVERKFREVASGEYFEGTIHDVDDSGHLVVSTRKGDKRFAVNDLQFIR